MNNTKKLSKNDKLILLFIHCMGIMHAKEQQIASAMMKKGDKMDSKMQAQIDKITKVSKVVRAICKVLLVILAIVIVLMIAMTVIGPEDVKTHIAGGTIPLKSLTPASKAILLLWLISISILSMKFLYHLTHLFSHYAEGRIFTAEPVAQIKRLGQTTLLIGAIQLLDPIVTSFVIFNSRLDGTSVTYKLPGETLIAGGLVILISWIMDVGRQLREESELTI